MFDWKSFIPQTSEISRASKLFVFDRDNDKIVTLITLIGSDRFNAHTVAGMLNDKIKEDFLNTEESDPIALIEKNLKKARQNLIIFIRNEPEIQDIGIDMHVTILWVRNNTFYVGTAGDNDIMLLRGKPINIGELIYNEQNVYHVGSGLLEQGDILLLGSPNTVDAFIDTSLAGEENPNWATIQEELNAIKDQLTGTQVIFSGRLASETTPTEEVIPAVPMPISKPPLPTYQGTNQSDFKGKIALLIQKINPFLMKIKTEYFPTAKEKIVQLYSKATAFIKKKLNPNYQEVDLNTQNEKQLDLNATQLQSEPTKPLSPWQRKLLSKFSFLPIKPQTTLSKIRPGKPIPIYQNPLFIAGVIGFILVLIIGLSINKSIKNKKYTQTVAEIETTFNETLSKLDNLKKDVASGTYDYTSISNEINTINQQIDSIDLEKLKEEDKNKIKTKQETAINDTQQLYNQINLIIPVSENNNLVFLMDTVTDCEGETSPIEFSKTGNYIALIGIDKNAVCIYNVNTQSGTLIDKGKENIEEPVSLTSYPDGFYVLDKKNGVIKLETQTDGIAKSSPSEFVISTVSALSARSVGSATKIKWYANNLYFLVPSESKVLRARGNEGVFNVPESYNSIPDNKFTYATDFIIDGSIYVITNSKQADSPYFNPILKYFGGKSAKLEISGLQTQINEAGTGYTADGELTPLLLVDKQPDFERIIIFEKPYTKQEEEQKVIVHQDTLVVKNQLQYQGNKPDVFKKINAILSDPSLTTIYVLDGSKLIKINM